MQGMDKVGVFASSAATDAPDGRSARQAKPDESALKAFEGAMRDAGERNGAPRHDIESGGLRDEESEAQAGDGQEDARGVLAGASDQLAQFFSQMSKTEYRTNLSQAPAEAQASPELDMEKLVSRLLVSAPQDAPSEVRLTLGEGVLAHSEIRMTRAPDGLLTVKLCAHDDLAFRTMVDGQARLNEALSDVEKRPVRIELEREVDDDTRKNDDARSSGLDDLYETYGV